ncbi:MAG TPA: PilZ domain-containing protein [Nitrospinota bacterium]|nr:PilZ domain-containing protein [Nitrospinota bacterium]HJN03142.1 PilZ domain-containing protein [Nitrospinota bacterium]
MGRLVESKLGEKVVPKVDSYLCSKVLRGDPIALRIISGEGTIVAFESELIEKKLPKLVLKFPEKESDKDLRTTGRTPAGLRAKIVAKSSENTVIPEDTSAVGTVQNLSDSGCSVTASVNLKMSDIVNFSITLSVKYVNKVFDLRGAIRRKKTDEYGRNNSGIEFFDDDRKILSGIRKFVESQKKTS